ncbi:MAG: radical SAM protein [Planctomycetota bacterium]|jgi:putative pyruvate formate lyase activating enzyme
MTMGSSLADHLPWAESRSADCRLCPRDCRVNRRRGELGWCGAGNHVEFFMEYVHFGEEGELAPSHTVFLSGCNLGCSFCHTATEREKLPSERLTPDRLAGVIARGRSEGALNLNFLGGEPSVSLPALLRVLAAASDLPPVVWNTNMYFAAEVLPVLDCLADTYLADLKFGNNDCSLELAAAGDYWDVARARLKEAVDLAADKVIVRHLVLPGHLDCCTRPALEWIAKELPDVRVSLRLDYLVVQQARKDTRLGRFLTREEANRARKMAGTLGIRLVETSLPGGPPSPRLRSASVASAKEVGPLPPPEGPGPGRPAPPREGRALDVEFVISPGGAVYVRHPTREAMSLGFVAAARKRLEDTR